MKLASCILALVTASECGPAVVRDGHFPVEFQATHFDITYGHNFKVLNNDLAKEQYVLTMCNSEKPKDATVDATAPLQDGFVRKHFTVPLQTYGSDTSGNQGYFNVLHVTDRQAYISEYVSEPCMQKAHKCSA